MQFLSQESYHLSTNKILFCIFPAAVRDINIYSGSELPCVIVVFCYYTHVLTPKLNPLPQYNVPGGAIQKKNIKFLLLMYLFFPSKEKVSEVEVS